MDELDNTRDIAEQIFGRPPQSKNTIELGLEEETSNIAQMEGADKFIFNILSIITMHGIEILFGHRNVLRLTEQDFNLLQEYTNSFGYKINKRVDEINNVLVIGFEKIY